MENQTIETGVENNHSETVKTYTETEVQAMLQSESDRRVMEALKKQEKKNKLAIDQAKKLAQMDEAQKFQYELEQKERDIAEREKQLTFLENKNEASKILQLKGIDISLVDFIVSEKAEDMMTNIDILDKAFKNAVKLEVENRLKSKPPITNTTQTNNSGKKMTLAEMQAMYKANPATFNKGV